MYRRTRVACQAWGNRVPMHRRLRFGIKAPVLHTQSAASKDSSSASFFAHSVGLERAWRLCFCIEDVFATLRASLGENWRLAGYARTLLKTSISGIRATWASATPLRQISFSDILADNRRAYIWRFSRRPLFPLRCCHTNQLCGRAINSAGAARSS